MEASIGPVQGVQLRAKSPPTKNEPRMKVGFTTGRNILFPGSSLILKIPVRYRPNRMISILPIILNIL